MRDDPGLDRARIAAAVEEQYGIPVRAVTWLPVLAAATATWFMWPFTACLTLGL